MTSHRLFLWLTLGLVLLGSWPELNFYPQLSQGDHGRDLYAAQAVLRGELPYKDFWWVYGPIMPYYYAIFYKLAGSTIVSFLLGKLVLKLACAAFFYLAAGVMMPPFVAFLAAVWFSQSQQDFFFTFNHIGGIACELWVLYMIFAYIKFGRQQHLWAALPAVFIYTLIKINFGVMSLLTLVGAAALTDWVKNKWPIGKAQQRFYTTALLILPAVAAAVYWLLLKDLPLYSVRQCMPYFGDDQPHHISPLAVIPYYLMQHWLTFWHGPVNFGVGLVLHSATILCVVLWATGRIKGESRTNLLLCLAALGMFFVLNLHEFLVSGVWYRTFWSLPFLFMFHFLLMSTAFAILPAVVRNVIWTLWVALLLFGVVVAIGSAQQQKTPPHFLSGPRAQTYVGNELPWTATVNTVDAFLKANLKPGELFLALPYDVIYYYLTDRPSPTRQLIFFDHIKIPPEQEALIIQELESKNVQYVLISNRMASPETGLGVFGRTYCPLLSTYVWDKYAPLAREGGDWNKEPGWGHNHGVLILKKK